jgi:UDP-2,3-diacylglucosamine pyrophosphatase LpxH
VIRRILTAAKRGTTVYYILGNHDEAFRKFLQFDIEVGNVKLLDRLDYTALNGKTYLVIHGDFFDALMVDKKWLMHIGDTLYDLMIWFNTHFNWIRLLLGLRYWSLSKWLKDNTKQAVNFINKYEDHVSSYCKSHGYNGIICGHIHHAEIKNINGVEYMNDGDWVESGTALLEHTDGTFEIYWHDKTNTDNN